MQSYRLDLHIAQVTAATRTLPSLLGRDVLNRWRMDYDPTRSLLTFTVRTADHTMN